MNLAEFIEEVNALNLPPALAVKIITLASRLASHQASRDKREASAERSRRYRAKTASKSTEEPGLDNAGRAADRHADNHAERHAHKRDGEYDSSSFLSSSESQSGNQEVREKDTDGVIGKADRPRETLWPSDAFEEFWRKYPEKVGKKAALKAFAAAQRTGVAWSSVMFGLDRYINEKPPDRAWCHPATWLNGARWDDEPAANGGVNERGNKVRTDRNSGTEPGQNALATGVGRAFARRFGNKPAGEHSNGIQRSDDAAGVDDTERSAAPGDGKPYPQLELIPRRDT